MFETQQVDRFYQTIKSQNNTPSKIILISPNHFKAGSKSFESVSKDTTKACFRNTCVPIQTLASWNRVWQGVFPDNEFVRQATYVIDGKEYIYDHGIGEHFQFIDRYFSGITVYPLLVDLYNINWTDQIISDLLWMIDGQTLIIFSIDFSHHNDVLFAKLHDKKTEYVLGNSTIQSDFMWTEVDCRNCLYIAKTIWSNYWLLPKLLFRDDQCSFIGNTECVDNTSRNFYLFSSGFTPPNGIILWAVGDTMYDRWVKKIYPNDSSLKQYFSTYFQKNDPKTNPKYHYHRKRFGMDMVLGNIEWPVVSGAYCTINRRNFVTFQNWTLILPILQSLWLTHLMTSNNHSLDCWVGARKKSNQIIKQSEIQPYGLISTTSEHLIGKKNHGSIATWTIRWIIYSLIGFDQTRFVIDKKTQCSIISSLTGVVIVTPHRGIEYQTKHHPIQETLAKYWIDCGADAIIGTHPHVVQDIDFYKKKPIIYSLGNFLFDQSFEGATKWIEIYLDIKSSGDIELRDTLKRP